MKRPGRSRGPLDWGALRDTIDLSRVISDEFGEPTGRRGVRASRPWWLCRFHEDRNPSLTLTPDGKGFKCFGCGASGDAVAFLRLLDPSMGFIDALRHLAGEPSARRRPRPELAPAPRRIPEPEARPSGIPEADAAPLVEDASRRLWSPEGAEAIDYLRGRGLAIETIRAARLGWTSRAGGVAWNPPGLVIPWFSGPSLALVKVRPPDAWRQGFEKGKRPPKYIEAFRHPARLSSYPGPEAIRPGLPLIVVEGEFDALCLGGALGGLAAVVTLGSASARPTPAILATFLAASPWYLATDGDKAGDQSAASWPSRARRVRPPGPFKDWSEAKADGVDLARWWGDILAGIEQPPLFDWPELAALRWGRAVGDPVGGIIVP